VTYVDLSEAEEREALATIDPLSALAETNADMLAELTASIDTQSEALREMLSDACGSDEGQEPHSLAAMTLVAPPERAWWLIGVPLDQAGAVVDTLATIPDIEGLIIESTCN
jgi:uncharacterized lipoprotein